jgi:oligopeptide transport system ATP-binding protein
MSINPYARPSVGKTIDFPLLAVRRLNVRYPVRGNRDDGAVVHAVEDLYLNLYEGETLGIVGESGCGKSTLARTLVGLERAESGAITYDGRDLAGLTEKQWRPLRRQIQLVFQDPLSSLDPRMSIGRIVAEPLDALYPEISRRDRVERVVETLERVGLSRDHLNRYPHEFSGGQCQRIGIARALVVQPRILICDEPVSALDASVQAQIINLLRELQRESGMALIFIAHDLAVVRHISRRVMVMYLGRVMESADAETLFSRPMHPYTKALLASVPGHTPVDAGSNLLEGELPDPKHPPSGCVFRTRCPVVDSLCASQVPSSHRTASGGFAACHYVAAAPEPARQLMPYNLA